MIHFLKACPINRGHSVTMSEAAAIAACDKYRRKKGKRQVDIAGAHRCGKCKNATGKKFIPPQGVKIHGVDLTITGKGISQDKGAQEAAKYAFLREVKSYGLHGDKAR